MHKIFQHSLIIFFSHAVIQLPAAQVLMVKNQLT